MSTRYIFYVAVFVFALMIIGVILTGREFKRMADDSRAGSGRDARK